MAQLILTEEERCTKTFLEWDDATLGKAVKRTADIIHGEAGGRALRLTGAAIFIIEEMLKNHADSVTLELTGVTAGAKELGNWGVSIERIEI